MAQTETDLFSFHGDCDNMRDSCVSSKGYPDYYVNGDSCVVTILKDVEIFPSYAFEIYDDLLKINGVEISSKDEIPLEIYGGSTIVWYSKSEAQRQVGWEICLREPETPSYYPSHESEDFIIDPLHNDCEVNSHGCVTDGEGTSSAGDTCIFYAKYDGFLHFPEFDLVGYIYGYENYCYDVLAIDGIESCGEQGVFPDDKYDPEGSFVSAGEEIKFQAKRSSGEGFTVCLIKFTTHFSFQPDTDKCQIDDNGCVSTGAGDYDPFDDCTIQIHHDGVLDFQYFNTQINSDASDNFDPCIDDLVIGGVEYCAEDGIYGATGNPDGITVTAGEEILWSASAYTQNNGWKICLITALTHFTIESDTGDCEIDVDGCVTDGSYADRESCTITVHQDGTLDFQVFDTEVNFADQDGSNPCVDDLVIQGVEYCSQNGQLGGTGDLNGITVTAGEQIEWSAGADYQGAGWKICLIPTVPVVDCTLPSDMTDIKVWNCNSADCSNPSFANADIGFATDEFGYTLDTSLYEMSDAQSSGTGFCTTTNTELQFTSCMGTYFIQKAGTNVCLAAFLVEDEVTCQDASDALNMEYAGVISASSKPYGCQLLSYKYNTILFNKIFFNTDTTNTIDAKRAPICTRTCSPAITECPDAYVQYDSSCYKLGSIVSGFNNAVSECDNDGAKAVEIQSQAEWDFLTQTFPNTNFWIGLQRDGPSDPWYWRSDGSLPTFTAWAGNQGVAQNSEHFVFNNPAGWQSGLEYDINWSQHALCEILLSVRYHLEHECTPGNHYSPQYTETETPTIQDCAKMCNDDANCEFFTYGTENGYQSTTGYTSDGVRANHCIFVSNSDFVSGWETECRWNLYSIELIQADSSLNSEVETEIGVSTSFVYSLQTILGTSFETYDLLALMGILITAHFFYSKCFKTKEYATIEEGF